MAVNLKFEKKEKKKEERIIKNKIIKLKLVLKILEYQKHRLIQADLDNEYLQNCIDKYYKLKQHYEKKINFFGRDNEFSNDLIIPELNKNPYKTIKENGK